MNWGQRRIDTVRIDSQMPWCNLGCRREHPNLYESIGGPSRCELAVVRKSTLVLGRSELSLCRVDYLDYLGNQGNHITFTRCCRFLGVKTPENRQFRLSGRAKSSVTQGWSTIDVSALIHTRYSWSGKVFGRSSDLSGGLTSCSRSWI